MYKNLTCAVIVVAGGKGTRFGGDLPKQFLKLGNKTVIEHSLATFEASPFIDQIIIVASSEFWGFCESLGLSKLSKIADSGETRQQSVAKGLSFVDGGLVLIHDAARPFVDDDKIQTLLASAYEGGGATLATPVTDTLKIADTNMCVDKTLPRESIFAVQTPQAFQFEVIKKAHEHGYADAYDDCQLVELLGIKPRLVRGSPQNIKITHPMDLEIAQLILAKRSK